MGLLTLWNPATRVRTPGQRVLTFCHVVSRLEDPVARVRTPPASFDFPRGSQDPTRGRAPACFPAMSTARFEQCEQKRSRFPPLGRSLGGPFWGSFLGPPLPGTESFSERTISKRSPPLPLPWWSVGASRLIWHAFREPFGGSFLDDFLCFSFCARNDETTLRISLPRVFNISKAFLLGYISGSFFQ